MSLDYRRFVVDTDLSAADKVTITGSEYRHLADVLRAHSGMQVVLLCGDGYDYTAEIESVDKKSVTARILSRTENTARYGIAVNFYCGALKGEGNAEQAAALSEAGAHSLTVIDCAYSVAKGANLEKLKRAAKESYKQCKRSTPLQIHNAKSFAAAVKISRADVKLIAYEQEKALTIRQVFENTQAKEILLAKDGLTVDIIIGSEGGFKAEEAELAKSCGFNCVTLGKIILKAPTAAVFAAALVLGAGGEV